MEQTFETLPSEELFRIPKNAAMPVSQRAVPVGFERIEHDQPEIDLTRPFTLSPYPKRGQLYRAYANKEDERQHAGCSFLLRLTFTRVTFGFARSMMPLSRACPVSSQRFNDYGDGNNIYVTILRPPT